MSTHCTFYRTGKRMNSTLRPSADGNTWGVDCNFFEPFDILSPEILLRDEGLGTAAPPNNNHIMDYNYVYIERPVDRYYFINKWERIKGIWHGYTSEDVLASWRSTILETQQYITRSSIKWNDYIPDTMYNYSLENYIVESKGMDASPYNPVGWISLSDFRPNQHTERMLVLNVSPCGTNCTLGSDTNNSDYAPNIIVCKASDYYKIISAVKNVDQERVKISEYINNIYWIPIPFTEESQRERIVHKIYFGSYKDASANGFSSSGDYYQKTWNMIELDDAWAVQPNHNIDMTWTGTIPNKSPIPWQNSSTYCNVILEFRPFGVLSLDPNLLSDTTEIAVRVNLNVATGMAELSYRSVTKDGNWLQLSNANISVPILLNTIINNYSDWYRSRVSNVASVVSTAAHAVMDPIGSMLNFVGSFFGGSKSQGASALVEGQAAGFDATMNHGEAVFNLMTQKPVQMAHTIVGSIGTTLMDWNPKIKVMRNIIVDRDDARFGRPLCEKLILGSQLTGATGANNYTISKPGLVVCQGAQIKSGTGTEIGQGILAAERAAIESALNGGVYLE